LLALTFSSKAHDSAIRAAAWSHSDDWLISADQDGVLKYWQPNFNNVKAFQAHENPIRDLAFSPTDSKFVTASDDATLKVWNFSGGVEESTLTGHGWDAKTVDWHPTKGLLVSGSKDHQVKLWDPRNGRCLTTLHGHKNPVSKTLFEPNRGQLLATCARDSTARIFDLRMMRDVLLLRGHEKDIMTLTWHPIHVSMLTTGGADGSLFHYLLDEPNPPPGTNHSISPYDSPDPANSSVQTIYPAHRVPYAHESSIWSLDWHPVGHILASGSNDRVTRFWTRARPGETECFNDRYHIGEAAAEAHGTWNRRRQGQQTRDEEEQEQDDEADGLIDQQMPARRPVMPGIANGTGAVGAAQAVSLLPGMGAAMPLAMAAPVMLQGVEQARMTDMSKLAEMFPPNMPPMPMPMPLPSNGVPPGTVQFPPPMPPFGGFQNGGAFLAPGMVPPGFPPPPGYGPPGFAQDDGLLQLGNGNGAGAGANGGSVRRRGPLPSQQEMMEQMKRGSR